MSLADEILKVSNEVRGNLNKKQFDSIYNTAVNKTFGYLLIVTYLPI